MTAEVTSLDRPWLATEPTALILQPTTLCNLDCSYCYLPARKMKRDMALSAYPVPDWGVDAGYVNDGIRAFFGVDIDVASVLWTPAHCDLHWGNLTAPRLVILDWEMWGRAPAGYDAASLLCATLLYPDSAKRLRGALVKFLDTPAGRVATLAAAVRLLRFADGGELTELAIPVRRYGQKIIEQL